MRPEHRLVTALDQNHRPRVPRTQTVKDPASWVLGPGECGRVCSVKRTPGWYENGEGLTSMRSRAPSLGAEPGPWAPWLMSPDGGYS